jgi:hypothetical protein
MRRRVLFRVLVATVAFAAAACGEDPGSPARLTGTVHGTSFAIADAISASVTYTTPGGRVIHEAFIALTNNRPACDSVIANTARPNEQDVIIELTDFDGATFAVPTAPGTYTVYTGNGVEPGKTAFFRAMVADMACNDVPANDAMGATGTVTLTHITSDAFAGTFDVMLDTGEHITGRFSPELCTALEMPSSTTPSCQ